MRVAGPSRGVPGFTEAEIAHRTQLRRAKANVRNGRGLAELWKVHCITFDNISLSDWAVLQDHWDRIDVQHVKEVQARGDDRNFRMPPLWNNPAHMR